MTCRHWPVVVMGVSDLPGSIAGGACALQPGSSFPLSLADVSTKLRAEEAYPVLVLGTQVSNARKIPLQHRCPGRATHAIIFMQACSSTSQLKACFPEGCRYDSITQV